MFNIIIISSLISLISLILLRDFAFKVNLIDYPSGRKNHIGNIPLIGGICVFLGVLIPYLFFIEYDKFSIVLLITASFMLILGVWDDFANLNAKTKIIFQLCITATMIYGADIKLESLGYLFGVWYPWKLGVLSVPFTIIAVIGLTNAINMIDGLDGLAVIVLLLAIVGIVSSHGILELSPIIGILLAVAFALLPFFIFNISPYVKMKTFLGDGGSLFLGYLISWALIYSSENISNFTPTFALWCVAIPLFDFLSVITMRMVKKQSLIIARKDHIHHFLKNLGCSKSLILIVIFSFGSVILLLGILIEKYFPALSFSIFLIFFLFYLLIRINNNFDTNTKNC